MTFKWISLIAVGLALSSCSAVGLDSSTRHISGVWLYEFESSTFVEGATGTPAQRPPYRESDWLDYAFAEPRLSGLVEKAGYDDEQGCYSVQPFRIAFIGHRTVRPFGTGHMGLWRSQVTVDRIVSIERLGPAFCYDDEVRFSPMKAAES